MDKAARLAKAGKLPEEDLLVINKNDKLDSLIQNLK